MIACACAQCARLQRRGRARQRGARAAGSSRCCQSSNLHGRPQASIFSTGSTSSALAPAFFRLSRVSQNTFSRHTAWTATRSGEPSSGMMVGDSLPGSSCADRRQRRARRVQHDVLAFLDLLDALDAQQQPLDPLVLCRAAARAACGSAPRGSRSTVCDLAQVIGLQRRAGGDQIADQIGAPQPRGDLDRPGERDDLGARCRARPESAPAGTDRWWRCACPRSDCGPS